MNRGKKPCVDQYAVGGAIAIASAAGQESTPPKVIQLFRIGAHPSRNGKPPVIRIDDLAHAERIVAASAAYHSSNDMVIDYDHQSVFGAKPGVGGRAPAAGWAPKLFANDEGIFAEVDWTEGAASALTKREYRYISPVFTHDRQGRPIAVINAALTNTPSLDLAAVASALSQTDGDESMNYGPIAKALGLGEDATEEEVLRAIANMNGSAATMTAIATALGAEATADLVAAATALKAKADNAGNPDPAKFVPVETVAQLTQSVQSLSAGLAAVQETNRKAKIDAAQADGRLPPALVAHASSITDETALDAFLGALSPGALGKPAVEGDPGSASGKLTAEELAACTALGVTEEEFIAERDGDAKGAK